MWQEFTTIMSVSAALMASASTLSRSTRLRANIEKDQNIAGSESSQLLQDAFRVSIRTRSYQLLAYVAYPARRALVYSYVLLNLGVLLATWWYAGEDNLAALAWLALFALATSASVYAWVEATQAIERTRFLVAFWSRDAKDARRDLETFARKAVYWAAALGLALVFVTPLVIWSQSKGAAGEMELIEYLLLILTTVFITLVEVAALILIRSRLFAVTRWERAARDGAENIRVLLARIDSLKTLEEQQPRGSSQRTSYYVEQLTAEIRLEAARNSLRETVNRSGVLRPTGVRSLDQRKREALEHSCERGDLPPECGKLGKLGV